MSDLRHYAKKQYTGNWSAFGAFIVFSIVGVLGIIFLYTPSHIDFIGLSGWGYYMFIPAFFSLTGGIGSLVRDRRLKQTVLITARAKDTTSANLENLSMETGIRANDILRILVDLRNEGQVKYKYNTTSGEVEFGETVKYVQDPGFSGPMTQRQVVSTDLTGAVYCPYCGHKPPSGAQFCESCGSKL